MPPLILRYGSVVTPISKIGQKWEFLGRISGISREELFDFSFPRNKKIVYYTHYYTNIKRRYNLNSAAEEYRKYLRSDKGVNSVILRFMFVP